MKPHAPLLAKLCLPLLAPALALGAASAQAPPAKRPNILLIVAAAAAICLHSSAAAR